MTDFLNNILSFPTLFYTGLLGLTLLYWLSSLFGFADFDFSDSADGIISESTELESTDATASSGWMSKFKLDGIPITISISLVIFFSWMISFLVVHYYQGKIEEEWIAMMLDFWVLLLAPIISAPIVGSLLSPLKPVFQKLKESAEGRKAHSLIGHTAIIRTNKVTTNFGDADIDIEGANLILKVRAEEPNSLKRGDSVVITDYIVDQNTYKVRLKSKKQ